MKDNAKSLEIVLTGQGWPQIRGLDEHLMEAVKMGDTANARYAGTVKQVRAEPMDIAASVIDELRTPITAILCAGENIRDGLLLDKDSLCEQGTIIIAQAMRLMIAVDVIDIAMNNAAILQNGEFALKPEIQPGLPALCGESSLLSQCLQSLAIPGQFIKRDSNLPVSMPKESTEKEVAQSTLSCSPLFTE